MQRITVTLDDGLMAEIDRIIKARGYQNRSEAIRDLARAGLEQSAVEAGGTRPCVAALAYVYDHAARELPKRLTGDFHRHHDLAQATLHVHLDQHTCMEVAVLKGRGVDVQTFANRVIAERGVRHGHLYFVPMDGAKRPHHRHAHPHSRHRADSD
jgi:CopG family nickel-responsive transcriptional regulator